MLSPEVTRAVVALAVLLFAVPIASLKHAPEERHLSLVIVLTRHGDRAPLYSFPSDRFHLERWPEGPGGLTPLGTRAMYELGKELRHHYIEDLEFLDGTYDRQHVYVRSSEVDRTLMSAYSLLYGMFPVGSGDIHEVGNRFSFFPASAEMLGLPNRAQPVSIRSTDSEMDGVLIPGGWCRRHTALQQVKRQTRHWLERQEHEEQLLALLTAATNTHEHILLGDIPKVADTWTCHEAHGIPLPPDGERLLHRARFASEWVRNYTNEGLEAKRLRAGLLLHEISKRLRLGHHVIKGHVPHSHLRLHSKFVLLSAHDATIAAALAALGVFDGRNPPYGSTLIWELHTHAHDIHDTTVRILYNKKPLHIPGCHGHEFCSLHDYLHATEHVTMRSHAQRFRECLTGPIRLGAEILHWFVPEPLDEDDIANAEHPQGGLVFLLFILFVGAGFVAAKTYQNRHGYIDSSEWARQAGFVRPQEWTQVVGVSRQEGVEAEERVRINYVGASSPGILS